MMRATMVLLALAVCSQADTLILKDGTKVTGRWWSLDAAELHLLVNGQLQHYRRSDVSAVTFGDAVLPAPPSAARAPTPAAPAAPAAPPSLAHPAPTAPAAPPSLAHPAPAAPAAPPSLAHPTPAAPAAPPSLAHPAPAAGAPEAAPAAPAPAPAPTITEPEQVGAVYFRNSSGDLTPLERNQAVERRRGSAQYWEILGVRSPVRFKAAPEMVFVVRLADGGDPEGFGMFLMAVANGSRRTQVEPGRKGAPLTTAFQIKKVGDSTYTFSVRNLAAGEYSFSPSGSNDAYCFGVDADR